MTPVPTTVLSSGECASPMRFAASRRKTSPNRARSRTAVGFWPPRSAAMPQLRAILALGAIAHHAVLAALGFRRALFPFEHGRLHLLALRV